MAPLLKQKPMPDNKNGFIDLHVHTTASDGTLSPSETVELAANRGLRAVAITDHDTLDGIAEALSASRKNGLEVLPGIELSSETEQGGVHIVGLMLDYTNASFLQMLDTLKNSRLLRAQRMVAKLRALGKMIDLERVLELAGAGTVGRPHVAQALLERGYVSTVAEAFSQYISRGRPAYVERYKITPVEAVRLIRNARGVPSLAHPIIFQEDGGCAQKLDLEALLPELRAAGLAGIEAYYPGYSREMTEQLLSVADRFGLVPTGGSDFHGGGMVGADLGSVRVPGEILGRLRAARAK